MTKTTQTPGVEHALIRELAALLDETRLSEIEVEREGLRLRVARQLTLSASAVSMTPPAQTPSAAAQSGLAGPENADGAAVPAGAVTSPMVGTAYVAPEPGAEPFVKLGENVSEGQTLLIVEAMKTMNPIPAPRAGKVTGILFTDGQPVEFGEPLVVIE